MHVATLLSVCLIIYNVVVPVTAAGQQQCTDRFMELDLISYRAVQTGNLNTILVAETKLLTEYQFNCTSANITSVMLGIDVRLRTGSRTMFPSIQLYRPGAGSVRFGEALYGKVDERMIYYSTSNVSTSGVFIYPFDPPMVVNSGDSLAVYQPGDGNSIVRVYYRNGIPFDTATGNNQFIIVYPITEGNCFISSNSITDSIIRQHALRVDGSVNVPTGVQYIYPEMEFSCNGTITKWIYGGTAGSGSSFPELQIWRRLSSNNFIKVGSSVVDDNTPIGTNVYEFIPQSLLEFQEGDIFGIHIPGSKKLELKQQVESGPINLRISGYVNNPLSTVNEASGITTLTSNNFPVVTAMISINTTSIYISTTTTTTTLATIAPTTTATMTSTSTHIVSAAISIGNATNTKTFKITEPIPSSANKQSTTITMTGLITTANTVIISTSVVVLVILLLGVVVLVVGGSLCMMRYRKMKQFPLQEKVTADTDIVVQSNPSYIPTGSEGINLQDNPSYSSTTVAADPNVDGVYIDINPSYNVVHHANSNEEDDYI